MSEIVDRLKEDVHPLGYYVVMRVSRLYLGGSEFALRFSSVLFGIASILLIYFAGKEIFSKRVGLLASLFLSLSYTAIVYSQEAKMYSMFMAVFLFSFLYFVKFLKRPSWKNIIILSLATGLLLHTHVLGLLIVVCYVAYYFIGALVGRGYKVNLASFFSVKIKEVYNLKRFIVFLLFSFILYLPWLKMFLLYQFPLLIHTLQFKLVEKTGYDLFNLIFLVCILIFLLCLILFYYILNNKNLFGRIHSSIESSKFNEVVFSIVLVGYVIFDLVISRHFFASVNFVRFLVFILPLIYIYLAYLFFKIRKRTIFIFLLSLFLFSASFELYDYYNIDSKEQFDEAALYVFQDAGSNDVMFLHRSGITKECFDYYYQGQIKEVRLVEGDGVNKIVMESRGRDYAYLLLSHNFQTHDFFKDEMAKLYPLVEHREFIGIDVYKFEVRGS